MIYALHKKQNGDEVLLDSDHVALVEKFRTNERGATITLRTGEKVHVSEQFD